MLDVSVFTLFVICTVNFLGGVLELCAKKLKIVSSNFADIHTVYYFPIRLF